LMQKKVYGDAEKLFRKACRLDPTCFQAWNNIGAIRLAQKDYPGAREYFLQADALVDLPMVANNLKYLARQGVGR
jgi:Flp pilus assembly protein TadD